MTFDQIAKPGNVAVVTGAAMGIGKAACLRFAKAGMSVCMVDLAGEVLDTAVTEVAGAHPNGSEHIDVISLDLSTEGAIETLHQRVIARFGRVDILMNNAVTRMGRGHDAPIAEWHTAMDVNFWAIVHAVRAFLPGMQAASSRSMIINVGSKQGITNPPGNPIYNITKSALKTYTEALEHELRSDVDRLVSAHLLIPGWTTTGNKPHQTGAWLPDQVVDFMVDALNNDDFYILCPDDEVSTDQDHRRIIWGAEDITKNRAPLSRWHADYAEDAKKNC